MKGELDLKDVLLSSKWHLIYLLAHRVPWSGGGL